MGVFSHGTPSSMPLEVTQVSAMMRDDQDSFWTTTFHERFYFSSMKNTC
jgi:hypothetical protein